MDQSIFRYTWRYSKRRSDLAAPRRGRCRCPSISCRSTCRRSIINGPIQGEGFASPGDTETAMRIAFDLPSWLFGGGEVVLFDGFEFGRITMLVYLCVAVPVLRAGERLLQVLHLDLQGPARRAHAAAHALPAGRHAAALPAAAVPPAALLRSRHHGEGRGGAARRLHRRRLRPAGLPAQPGGHRHGVHPDAEHHARPRGRRDRRRADRADPAASAPPARARAGAAADGAPARRPRRRDRRGHHRRARQRRVELGAGRDIEPARRASSSSASTSISGSSWSNSSTTCSPR